ncbi:unnamed protein product [Rhizopus stolonifer]
MQGNPEPQRARTVTVRPIARVQLSGDMFRFMKALGYSYSFEVVKKGYLIAYDNVLKVTVSRLYKLRTKVDVSSAVPFGQEDTWIIEVTTLPVPQEQVNQMAEHLNKFKVLLTGYNTLLLKCMFIFFLFLVLWILNMWIPEPCRIKFTTQPNSL